MSLRENTTIKVSYLLSHEEPKVPFLQQWIVTRLADDLPIIPSMYLISVKDSSTKRFNTVRIRRLNPDLKFYTLSGNRQSLPERLFNLLPTRGHSTSVYPTPPEPMTEEEKNYSKVIRTFVPDGIFHDMRVTIDDFTHRLQIVYRDGKFHSWRWDNPEWSSKPCHKAVHSTRWRQIIIPLTWKSRKIYDSVRKHHYLPPLE